MGEIEISKIKNDSLKQLLYSIDHDPQGNKDGKINSAFEESALRGTSRNLEEFGKDLDEEGKAELKEIMGLQTSEIKTANFGAVTGNALAQPKAGTVVTSSAINSKEAEKAVKKNVKYWIKNGARPDELVSVLRDRIKDSSYQSAINDVEKVLALINATNYNSKADVKAIESKVKPQLTTKFQKEVLKELVKQAEMEQIVKEEKVLKERYDEIVKQNNGKNYGDYAEQLKKELKASKKWDESYTKEAFKLLEETDVKGYAVELIKEDIQKAPGMKDKDVRKNTKANYTDKKVKKVVDKEFKDDSKVFARKNKTEAKKAELANGLTQKQIEKEVGKDTFEILKRSYLADTPNNPHILPNGKYDLSELSDIILKRFGANYYGDRNDGDKVMAEFNNLKAELKDVLGVKEDLSDRDVKDIIKLCAFELQGRDRSAKYILDRALFGLPSAVGAAAGAAGAALLLGNKDIINYYTPAVNVAVNVTTKITAEMAQETCNVLKELGLDATFDASVEAINKIDVHIPEEYAGSIDIDHTKDFALKTAAGALACSIAINALTAAIFGGERNETSCMSVSDYDKNDPKYTDPDKFKEHFANTTQNEQKIAQMNALVDLYVAKYGDKWHEELQNEIRKAAGLGSKLNPEECRMFFRYNKPSVDVPKVEDKPEDEVKPEKQCEIKGKETPEEDTTKTYKTEAGDTWTEIWKAFYGDCLAEAAAEAGMSPERYLKRELSRRPDGTIDEKMYKSLRTSRDLPKVIKLPAKIGNCERLDGTVKKTNFKKGGRRTIDEAGYGSKKAGEVSVGNSCGGKRGHGATRQEAIADYNKKNNKNITEKDVKW